MRQWLIRGMMAVSMLGACSGPVSAAEDAPRALPTLLIKGEVVSVDVSDPNASLLKVKDRYGFETPIYLTSTTKISQGDQALTASGVQQGSTVEVEYNFDVNTAKRHAVAVKVTAAVAAPAAAAEPATSQAQAGVSVETAAPVAEAAPEPAASGTEPAASSDASAPASDATTQEPTAP
ncbi:MAG: hypothetical protein HYY15_03580 [Candidatus Omnitrophica bacterium]|nr:hypothetical protein [Candidatus Omnitrophota bacterium]